MKTLRKPLLLLIAIAALTGAGAIESFNHLAVRYRGQVIQELAKVLGDDVSFAALQVNFWGRPGFVATEFRIADDNRFAATPAVRARKLILGINLWDLLWRGLVIRSITFEQPELQIITDERGELNLSALIERKSELRKFPRLRAGNGDRKPMPISFAVDEVSIEQGRIDYIDRSIRQPAELQVRNVSMRIRGFQPEQATEIEVGASLTPGLRQDLRINGAIAGTSESRSWLERAIDLDVQIDSLHVPVVARAIAALRDRIPSELDVTGPMALKVQTRGTLERPRLENIVLQVPLFGSTEYNAVITGHVRFGERRSWKEAELDGTLVIDPLALNRLRGFATFNGLLPEGMTSGGHVKIVSRFAGTWEDLRVGALVLADQADLRYKDWLHKPVQMPSTIRARMSRHKQGFVVHPSELEVGAEKLRFSGAIDYESTPLLRLQISGSNAPIASWGRLVSVPGLQAIAGKADVNVSASKRLNALEAAWDLRGSLKLADTTLRHIASGRAFDDLQAQISFEGTRAIAQNARVRLGSSNIVIDRAIAALAETRLTTAFRAETLQLADLPALSIGPAVRLVKATGFAEIFLSADGWRLTGSLAAPESSINGWPLRDVRADIEWQQAGLSLRNIEARAFQGAVRAEGFLPGLAGQTRPFVVSGKIDGVDARSLLVRWFPPLRDRIDGRLSGHARFEAAGPDAAGTKDPLSGSGQAEMRNGVIRNFNLATQLLAKGSDSAARSASLSRMPPGFTALLQRRDTAYDSVTADFKLEQNRLTSDNLVITTPDYTITGAGWLDFNRTTRWNGMLVLSPRLTEEIQRDYRSLRYLLDRRGRLALGFRVDGQIPDVTVRLENRALAQALGFDAGRRGGDEKGSDAGKRDKDWIPDALERYLNR